MLKKLEKKPVIGKVVQAIKHECVLEAKSGGETTSEESKKGPRGSNSMTEEWSDGKLTASNSGDTTGVDGN